MKFPKFDGKQILIALACGALAAIFVFLGVFGTSERRVHDALYKSRTPQPDIVIVAVDDASLQAVGNWMWSRATFVNLLNDLSAAKIIGLDVNFSENSQTPDADANLAAAISALGKVVLPADITYLPDNKTVAHATTSIPIVNGSAAAVAHTSAIADLDGVLRRLRLIVSAPDGNTYHAMGEIVALRAGARVENYPLDANGLMLIPFSGGPGHIRTVSAADVLSGRLSPESFRNQIVFVGGTSASFPNQYHVPTSSGALMSNVEVEANLADAFLSGTFFYELPPFLGALLCLLLSLFVGLIFSAVRTRNAVIAAVIIFAAYAAVFGAFALTGYFLPLVNIAIAIGLSCLVLILYRYVKMTGERRQLRSAFEKYVAPSVINSVMSRPDKLELGGERRNMTVLFTDLRGFTTLSEKLSPAVIVKILNGYLNAMTEIIFDEHGVLDKYMGDSIMAFWGAPIDDPHHAERSIRAAIRMRDRVNDLNHSGYFGTGVTLRAGVGISTGDMIVGNMGSNRRFDYTVIGDTVNVGSRVEGMNKLYGTEILVTEDTVKGLSRDYVVRQLDRVAVKGKNEPVRLYEVVGFRQHAAPEVMEKLERFARALARYEARDFHGASIGFGDILALNPSDAPSHVFWERSKYFMENPPPADWGGVWVMQTK